MQLQAGYILDSLFGLFEEDMNQKEQVVKLAQWLSFFELNGDNLHQHPVSNDLPLLNVLSNLLQRGTPTRMNLAAFDFIANSSTKVNINNSEFSIDLKWDEKISELVRKSLHIIDPRISKTDIYNNYK